MIFDLNTRTSKVCCIADLHIGVHQNSTTWHNTALQWAEWLAGELAKQDIHDIFILGDVYHYRDEIAVNTMHVVNEIFSLWRNFNITILVGNHDAFYKDNSSVNSLSIIDGKNKIRVIDKPQTFTLYGKTLTFLPWGASLSEVTKSDILFGHMEVEGFKMNSYKLCEHGMNTRSLFDKAKLIMTGHFHQREERVYDNGAIIYVGNPYEMDYGDINTSKGYYILDINTLEYQFYENNISPKHTKITITDLQKSKNADSIFANNIVRIVVDGKHTTENIDSAIKQASNLNPLSLTVDYSLHDNTINVVGDTNIAFDGVVFEQTVKDFINTLDVLDKEDVINYCIEMLGKVK